MGNSKPLTAKAVEAQRKAGVYRDKGNPGLLLRVEANGSKRWVLRTTVSGRRRDFGLGSARDVTLREAREQAAVLRREARAGRDPAEQRRAARRARLSFEAAAEKVHGGRQETWRNTKHQAQWISTLRTYAFPTIGKMAVGDVQAADVLKVLAPIWLTKPETARRVRQRIGVVLDWATTAGHRSSLTVNAALAVRAGLPKQAPRTKHHSAVPWREIPAFVKELRETPSTEAVRFALEFTLLTAARTGETIGARWAEIDLIGRTWTVPAERMKGHREHRVPLSEPVVQILEACRERWPDSKFVFPGRDQNGPLSNMALLMLMRRLGRKKVPHGLRSSFRDWAADNRKDRDLAEAALAHALADKTEAAYRHSDLFDGRRELMMQWASFVTTEAS
jgi:integrase